jgi:hypothetical protein
MTIRITGEFLVFFLLKTGVGGRLRFTDADADAIPQLA